MIQLLAFRRALLACALAFCSIVALSATPADARPRLHRHHSQIHLSQTHHRHRVASRHHLSRYRLSDRHHARQERYAGRRHARRIAAIDNFRNANAALTPQDGVSTQAARATPAYASGTGSSLVAQARSYIGGNPTGRSRLWCARFMNMVLQRAGLRTTGSDMARSFANYGRRVSGPQVGAIAVMGRRGGGHVGIVSGVDSSGNPIVVSGNHNHRVAEAVYSRSRIQEYVMPN